MKMIMLNILLMRLKAKNLMKHHLYVQDTPTAAHGRGLGQAKVYTQDGELVACMTQEVMLRVPEEDLKK